MFHLTSSNFLRLPCFLRQQNVPDLPGSFLVLVIELDFFFKVALIPFVEGMVFRNQDLGPRCNHCY